MIYAICLLLITTGFVMAALTDYLIKDKGYEPSKRKMRKPEDAAKIGFFDVDNYKPETI